ITPFLFASNLFYTKAVKPSPLLFASRTRVAPFCCRRPKQPSIVFLVLPLLPYTRPLATVTTVHLG
uniref:Uncharacterized protein n=1 Tax=Romanomermis culicivorax TaxID=13658 RepID=A0A915IRM6_ROMCU